ncbi:hypothetical protein [Maribacter sp. 2307ULW6-5]|uniref:hypothetical protein n=1 Tax=Maribacter sp. 2307ULW6-5 TaxID=3386275 RepID=UPI0039BC3B69
MRSKKSRSFLFIALSLALIMAVGAVYTSSSLKKGFNEKVLLFNQEQPVRFAYAKMDLSLWSRSFTLHDVRVVPTDTSGNRPLRVRTSLASFKVSRFQVLPLLFKKELRLDGVTVQGLRVVYRGTPNFSSDGISGNGGQAAEETVLKGIEVARLEVRDYQLLHLDAQGRDTLHMLQADHLSISGLSLHSNPLKGDVLALNGTELRFELRNQTFYAARGKDRFSLDTLMLDLKKGRATMAGLSYGDKDQLNRLAAAKKYNTPVNAFTLPQVEIFGLHTQRLLQGNGLVMDSLLIKGPTFHMLKDTRKPWNKERTLPLLTEMIRNVKFPFWVDALKIHDLDLDYVEVAQEALLPMPINAMNATVLHLGNIAGEHAPERGASTSITATATAFKELDFSIALLLTDPLNSDEFTFKGSTGPFTFESFNPIMVPTSSIKFESGNADRVLFSGRGNAKATSGELTMYFHGLNAVVLKRDMREENKAFSFLANKAVRRQNPKNGKLKTAMIHYERRPYKGFGNYLVKSLESGLLNSVYPFGKREVKGAPGAP